MFFIARIIIVVALIYCLSPAHTGAGRIQAKTDEPHGAGYGEKADAPFPQRLDELARMWAAVPDRVRRESIDAVSDEVRGRLEVMRRSEKRPSSP